MTAERRADHATRAALLRLRLVEKQVADLLAIDDLNIRVATELSAAIDGVVDLLRRPGPMILDQRVFAQMLGEHQDMIAKRLFRLGGMG